MTVVQRSLLLSALLLSPGCVEGEDRDAPESSALQSHEAATQRWQALGPAQVATLPGLVEGDRAQAFRFPVAQVREALREAERNTPFWFTVDEAGRFGLVLGPQDAPVWGQEIAEPLDIASLGAEPGELANARRSLPEDLRHHLVDVDSAIDLVSSWDGLHDDHDARDAFFDGETTLVGLGLETPVIERVLAPAGTTHLVAYIARNDADRITFALAASSGEHTLAPYLAPRAQPSSIGALVVPTADPTSTAVQSSSAVLADEIGSYGCPPICDNE